jgi:hypothetical protein
MRTIKELLQNKNPADIKDAYFMRKKHVEKKKRKELIAQKEKEIHKNRILKNLSFLYKLTPSQERQLKI